MKTNLQNNNSYSSIVNLATNYFANETAYFSSLENI